MAIVHIDVPNGSGIITQLKDTEYYSWSKEVSRSTGRSEFDNKILTLGTNLSAHGGDYTYNFGNVDIIWNQTGDGGDTSADIRIYFAVKNHSTGQLVANLEHNWHVGGNRSVLENYIEFAVDHSNQKGYVVRPNISLMNWSNKYGMEVALEDGGLELYKLLYPAYTSNGGGATHIAKRTGQLKDLSSYTSDILIVSGGGGGGLLVGSTEYTGKDAGGISGNGYNSANQSTGYGFGLGESGEGVSGGGGGFYGGYKGGTS